MTITLNIFKFLSVSKSSSVVCNSYRISSESNMLGMRAFHRRKLEQPERRCRTLSCEVCGGGNGRGLQQKNIKRRNAPTVNRISTSELALTSHFVGPDLIRRLTPRFLLFNHKNEFDFQIRKLVSRRRAQLRDVTSFL